MDESLFDHIEGRGKKAKRQIWLFCLVPENDQTQAIIYHVPDRKGETLAPIIARHVDPRGTLLHHDGWPGYSTIPFQEMGIAHEAHRHKMVDGHMDLSHCNAVEGLWHLLKRALLPFGGQQSAEHIERWVDSAYLQVRTSLQKPGSQEIYFWREFKAAADAQAALLA